MKSIHDLLHEHPFFEGLTPEMVDVVSGCGINVHLDPGEVLFAANDPADRFFVLRRGKVALEIDTPRSGPLVIGTLGPGEVLGVSWILPPYRASFDARAIEDTSAVSIDAACLRDKCDADHELGYNLYKRFAGLVRDRLQATRVQLLDVYGSHDS